MYSKCSVKNISKYFLKNKNLASDIQRLAFLQKRNILMVFTVIYFEFASTIFRPCSQLLNLCAQNSVACEGV